MPLETQTPLARRGRSFHRDTQRGLWPAAAGILESEMTMSELSDFAFKGALIEISELRAQRDKLREALQTARSLIIQHHECGVMQQAGIICPVCSKDGERALNSIYNALNETA